MLTLNRVVTLIAKFTPSFHKYLRFSSMRDSLGLFPCLSLIHFNYLNSLYKKAGAEVYKGSVCGKKTMELLELVGLLNDLILLDDIEECSYKRDTGRVSMKRKKKVEAIGGLVQYETHISGHVEQPKIKEVKKEVKITEGSGVKSKEVSGVKIKEVKIKDVKGVKIQEASGGKVTISEISIHYPQAVSKNSTMSQIKQSGSGRPEISAEICFKGDGFKKSFEIAIAEIGDK